MNKIVETDKQIVEFSKFTTELSNKLVGTEELHAEEQWYILLNLYLSMCEMIKFQYDDYIRDIYNDLTDKSGLNLGRFLTMWPFKEIMIRYKDGKYSDSFVFINVDLRNAIAHMSYRFDENDNTIHYSDTSIEGLELLKLYRMSSVLFSLIFINKMKVFSEEYEEFAKEKGII